MIILDQVKLCWASENICWASAFPIYLPGGKWIEKTKFWPCSVYSLFNSSRHSTLYIVGYFTIPHRLFYGQKIGWLLWFWRKSGPECTKYFYNFFRGKSQLRRATIVFVWLPLPHGQPFTNLHPPIHSSPQQHRSNGVTVFIQATTSELLPTFYCLMALIKKKSHPYNSSVVVNCMAHSLNRGSGTETLKQSMTLHKKLFETIHYL